MEEHLAQMTITSTFLSQQVCNLMLLWNPRCARVMGFLTFFPFLLFVPAWLCYVFMCFPVGKARNPICSKMRKTCLMSLVLHHETNSN